MEFGEKAIPPTPEQKVRRGVVFELRCCHIIYLRARMVLNENRQESLTSGFGPFVDFVVLCVAIWILPENDIFGC